MELRQADQRDSFERMDLGARADEVEEARNDVDLNLEIPDRPDELEQPPERILRERDDHPLDVELADDAVELRSRPEDRQLVAEIRVTLLRTVVDEAEELDAVLGMLLDPPRDELPDLARADNYRVLRIGGLATAV